jgi:CRP/FNR family transcriptional regulator, cyclic AMP receptor protein
LQDGPEQERERLLKRYGKKWTAGEVIFREGDESSEMYILQEGRVRLVKRVRATEKSLLILRPGDLFGENVLIEGQPRACTAMALTDCTTLALDVGTFESLLKTDSAISLRLVRLLVRRLKEAEDQIENMMIRDAQSKIVNTLLKLSQEARARGEAAGIALSPMELSSRVGLDVDSVKRGIQQLRDSQYVTIRDERIQVPDVEALRGLYQLLGMKEDLRK